MSSEKSKISIVTVCYNSEKTIADTLNSVCQQQGVDVEHILIDGVSKDATLDIIKQYPSVSLLVSEPDNGIYDAMNKGIKRASGDIIGTLNADDFYADNNVLQTVEDIFQDTSIDACYADLVYVKEDDVSKVVRYWKSVEYKPGLFKSGWMPAHPTFFVRRSAYEKYGLFDLSYQIAADFELLFRLIEKSKIKTKYIPKVLVTMRLGGTTNKSFTNICIQNNEIVKTLRGVYPDFSLFRFIVTKLANRFKQFMQHPKG